MNRRNRIKKVLHECPYIRIKEGPECDTCINKETCDWMNAQLFNASRWQAWYQLLEFNIEMFITRIMINIDPIAEVIEDIEEAEDGADL